MTTATAFLELADSEERFINAPFWQVASRNLGKLRQWECFTGISGHFTSQCWKSESQSTGPQPQPSDKSPQSWALQQPLFTSRTFSLPAARCPCLWGETVCSLVMELDGHPPPASTPGQTQSWVSPLSNITSIVDCRGFLSPHSKNIISPRSRMKAHYHSKWHIIMGSEPPRANNLEIYVNIGYINACCCNRNFFFPENIKLSPSPPVLGDINK